MNLNEEAKAVSTERGMPQPDARANVASLSSQQLTVMANPNYERLVKLIFEGKLLIQIFG